jgi:2-alkyl-3-oxoalkanoate reductase
MHAIVTGATGFFGGHLVRELTRQGWTVTAIVRRPYPGQHILADLATAPLDPEPFRQADVVFHVAGVLSDWAPWSHFFANTVEATRHICEVTCGRLVYISSVSVYGRPHTTEPIDESWPPRSMGRWNYYMRTKLMAEELVRQKQATIIRPAIMYGANDHTVLAGVTQSLRCGKIAFIGDPETPLPLVDVRDVARGTILAATSDKAVGEAFNMVNPETVTQREYFNTIAALIGASPVTRRLPYRLAYTAGFATEAVGHLLRLKAVPLTRHRVSLFGHRRLYSIAKAKQLLGWEPAIRFQDGIRSALNAVDKP